MLAKVEPALVIDRTAAAPMLRFTVAYDPSQQPEQRFSFFDEYGEPHDRLFLIDRIGEVQITLKDGATFSQVAPHPGINWLIPPPGGLEVPSYTDGQSLEFSLPALPHALAPVAFTLVVDTQEVKGILSPPLYLANSSPEQQENLKLFYHFDSSAFLLRDGSGTVFTLDSKELLVVTIPRPQTSYSITFDLQTIDLAPEGTMIEWGNPPVVWTYMPHPSWLTLHPLTPGEKKMTMTFGSSGAGGFTGFQFAICLSTDGGTSWSTVLSPDPILVNATIGDG